MKVWLSRGCVMWYNERIHVFIDAFFPYVDDHGHTKEGIWLILK